MNTITKRVCATVLISLVTCYIIICVSDSSSYLSNQIDYTEISTSFKNKFTSIFPSSKFSNETSTDFIITEKVVIGLVFCRKGKQAKGNFYYAQAFTLIKSLLISCKLYSIPTLDIHLFLEHPKDEQYFRDEIKEKLYFPDDKPHIQLNIKVHSAFDAVPKQYHDHMIYHERFRCSYVRHYFPESLPNVDSIIHLDTDMIVTGNIGKHWQFLSKMNENQILSVAYGRQPANDKYKHMDSIVYKDVPFVPPKGVQPAVIVMNLTRMREFKFSEKITRIYQDYSRIQGIELHDMKVFNILLYFNPRIYLIFPCQLHFVPNECDRGFFCETAFQDPDGLHLMHGNAGRFSGNQVFSPVYKYYSKFNISDPQSNLTRDLMIPIQEAYKVTNSTPPNPCYGTLNKVLFKRFLSIADSSTK